MFEDYFFPYTPGPYLNVIDQLNAQSILDTFLEFTEADIRAGIPEFIDYVNEFSNQFPSDAALSAYTAILNRATPNNLTTTIYIAQDAQGLVNDFIGSHPNFELTTNSVNRLISDATEASRIGIGLEFLRPLDFPPIVAELPIPSFDFSYLQINSDLNFASSFDFGTSFDFNLNFDFGSIFDFNFSSGYDFNFDFSFDFAENDYWNFADFYGET
jgi:hypothetical protein